MMRGWIAAGVLVSAIATGCGPTDTTAEADALGSSKSAAWGCTMEPSSTGCWWFTCNSDFSYEEACAGALEAGTDYCASRGGVDSRSRLCAHNATTPPYQGNYLFCCQ
ncbi:hypothetical protein JY651_20490 [Pyxidicoccus parkwayensis]|uniref:Lipoprotein n=1 Tax=Pyxidicoccus parkwayensis TaxID=2813578 RepID=A0ABX7P9L7_9BACT|nr:hypothetical protein [Pyxidicoccus parkwaysis]QSQ27142.1 hypothetical protein JY651_20490 [Pyxidicoccus parkwaysis]